MSKKTFKIAVIGGDSIGPSVVEQGTRVYATINDRLGRSAFEITRLHGITTEAFVDDQSIWTPKVGARIAGESDAVFFGAFGRPDLQHDLPGGAMCLGKPFLIDWARGDDGLACIVNARSRAVCSPHHIPTIHPDPLEFHLVEVEEPHAPAETLSGAGDAFQGVYVEEHCSLEAFLDAMRRAIEIAKGLDDKRIVVPLKREVFTATHGEVWLKLGLPKVTEAATAAGVTIEWASTNIDAFLAKLVMSPQSVQPVIVTSKTFAALIRPGLEVLRNPSSRTALDVDGFDYETLVRCNRGGFYVFDGEHSPRGEDHVGIQRARHDEQEARENVAWAIAKARQLGQANVTVLGFDRYQQTSNLWWRVAGDLLSRGMSVSRMPAQKFVTAAFTDPNKLSGVFVAPNMLGDLLGDLALGFQGGMGLGPSHCENVSNHGYVSTGAMFAEPVHGSAVTAKGDFPDNPNPTAAMLSAAEQADALLGTNDWVPKMRVAIAGALEAGIRTPDIAGGTASTKEFADAVLERI